MEALCLRTNKCAELAQDDTTKFRQSHIPDLFFFGSVTVYTELIRVYSETSRLW